MKIILEDGSIFEIDEDTSSTSFIDKIIRIMKYMTFSDTVIAKGLSENLFDLAEFDLEVEKIVKKDFKDFLEKDEQ